MNVVETPLSEDKKASELPQTFDEVAQQIAKEKGIVLEEKPLIPIPEDEPIIEEEQLSPSIIDEDNRKVRTVIKTLEEWGWHPMIQKDVKLYVSTGEKNWNIVNTDENGKKHNSRSSFQYFHYELTEQLFFYQDAVNAAIRNEDYNFSLRKKLIIFLGCKCLFCGNEDVDYLQLDHKDSKGGKERKRYKERRLNPMLFYWNNLVDAYLKLQVLCFKCHKLKSTFRIRQAQIDEKVKEVSN